MLRNLTGNWRSIGPSVVMVELKGVHKVKSNGKTYFYAWRGGPRIHAEYGTPEFFVELQEIRDPVAKADKKKFGAWITLYLASPQYAELADTTKRVWSKWFDHIRDEFGALSVRQFARPQIRTDIEDWRDGWRDRPRAADTGKQVLSRILSFIVSKGELPTNPCEGIPNIYDTDRSDIIWEPDDIETLLKHASPEVGYAARLAACTGLRQTDLLKLSWSHIRPFSIEIKTGKSKKRNNERSRSRKTAIVPLTKEIKELLELIPKVSTTILTNSKGRPWRGFGASWNKTMHDAGLHAKDLHFHDFRGTAATRFYQAGFTIREIADTLGWDEERVERIIKRYVNHEAIMRDRIRRLEEGGKTFTPSA